MKKLVLTITCCAMCAIVLSGCTNQPTSLDEKPLASPTSEPETTLVPVKQIDPSANASASQVLDEGIQELDSMAKDLQTETFSDLPTTLGQ